MSGIALDNRDLVVCSMFLTVIEFDFRTLGDGSSASARYANNSNYRNDSLIRKESTSHSSYFSWTRS